MAVVVKIKMQSLLEKFRLHVSSERRRRREKKLPYRFRFVSFYFFHFRTLSYFLIIFDTSEWVFFFAFYVSFRFCVILFWCFVGMGKKIYLCWTAEGRNKVSKIKVRLYCKINKVSFQTDRYSKQGIFHDIF